MLVRGHGGQRDQDQEGILVKHDEEEIEQLKLPGTHRGSKDRPAVVLDTAVATLSGEVVRES